MGYPRQLHKIISQNVVQKCVKVHEGGNRKAEKNN